MALLAARLQERESDYALVVEALRSWPGSQSILPFAEEVAREERDDTPEALDKIWEEEMVSFATGDPMGRAVVAALRATVPPRRNDKMMSWRCNGSSLHWPKQAVVRIMAGARI